MFVSDELITLLVRSGVSRTGASQLFTFLWTGTNLQPTAKASKDNEVDHLYAASGNRVFVVSRFHKYLYSVDFKVKQPIPIRILVSMFPHSGVVGDYGGRNWATFWLSSPLRMIKSGSGELLSVSNDAIVYRQANEVRTETTDGRLLGVFPVSPDTKGSTVAEIAGRNRLYLNTYGKEHIADFNGRELRRIRPPDGWGFRYGWNADGSRMLFDNYTRNVSVWEKVFETIVDALPFGGVPEQSNGEVIRVVDTATGKICFHLESPNQLLGHVGGYHADLSPSGRLVVVATLRDLSIYRLPETCTQQ